MNRFDNAIEKSNGVEKNTDILFTVVMVGVCRAMTKILISKQGMRCKYADVMDAKQLAKALQISKAGAYNLLSAPNFPTLRIGGRKMVMKSELIVWLKWNANRQE